MAAFPDVDSLVAAMDDDVVRTRVLLDVPPAG
jgi:hypothetical protein